MKTKRRILFILGAIVVTASAAIVALVVVLGAVTGLEIAALALVLVAIVYQQAVHPWHTAWGSTAAEVAAPLPGDELVPHATSTTRTITVHAAPDEVWPWLVQIGFGRGGWYSYDWIDNDGRPSARRIVPELQDLAVGDRIPMTNELGFRVTSLDPPHSLVAISDDGSVSWCLHVEPRADGSTRLTSRFRTAVVLTPAALAWSMVTDPGTFIMERRMLRGIRRRATTANAATPRPAHS